MPWPHHECPSFHTWLVCILYLGTVKYKTDIDPPTHIHTQRNIHPKWRIQIVESL